jgi:hypothetical protein
VAVKALVVVALGVAVGVGVAVEGCSLSAALTCPALSLACPSLDGVTSFCTWRSWGCLAEPACGGYFAVVDVTVDGKLTYFYSAQTGAYVATVQEDPGGGHASCANGASSFTPPASCTFATLATCAPLPQDAGLVFRDASLDAADTGPPQGIPSGQPLARPPRPTAAR